jgi:tRNA G46 methylase TrmB
MRLIDCGCGPGSITIDLARIVAPGEVVGIDRRQASLSDARTFARERGVANVGPLIRRGLRMRAATAPGRTARGAQGNTPGTETRWRYRYR